MNKLFLFSSFIFFSLQGFGQYSENVTMTGPYMNNGNYKSLRKVVEFYNKGGGAGTRLKHPKQTLNEKPLLLSKAEINDIVAFLGALRDNISDYH